jgi:hypothetical protein
VQEIAFIPQLGFLITGFFHKVIDPSWWCLNGSMGYGGGPEKRKSVKYGIDMLCRGSKVLERSLFSGIIFQVI